MSDYTEPDFEEDFDEVPPPVTYYTQMRGERTNYPFSCDCSGLVWWCYLQQGLHNVMFPSENAGVLDMVEYFEATQWRAADLIIRWNDTPQATKVARFALNQEEFLREGDLLFRRRSPSGLGDHVAFFIGWSGSDIKVFDASPTNNPTVGENTLPYTTFVDTYTHVVRPKPVGALMVHRYASGIAKPVEVRP